jgi:hypothetical protein
MTKIYYVSIFFFHFHALYSLWEKFFFSLTHNSHRFYASFYLFSYLIKRKTLIFLCSFCYDDINVSSSVFFFLSGLTVHLALNIFITISWHFSRFFSFSSKFYDFIIREKLDEKDKRTRKAASNCWGLYDGQIS